MLIFMNLNHRPIAAKQIFVQLQIVKGTGRFANMALHLRIPPLAALSSQTGPQFSLGGSRPSPLTRTLTCAAIQLHIALICRLIGSTQRNSRTRWQNCCSWINIYL